MTVNKKLRPSSFPFWSSKYIDSWNRCFNIYYMIVYINMSSLLGLLFYMSNSIYCLALSISVKILWFSKSILNWSAVYLVPFISFLFSALTMIWMTYYSHQNRSLLRLHWNPNQTPRPKQLPWRRKRKRTYPSIMTISWSILQRTQMPGRRVFFKARIRVWDPRFTLRSLKSDFATRFPCKL